MIDVRQVQALHPTPVWSPSRQAHPFHELVLLAFGRYELAVGGKRLRGTTGDLFLIPKGLMHQGCVRKQTQTRLYLVQWTGGWPDLEQTCHQVADYHGLSLPLVEWLLQKWRGGDPREEIDALMRTLFLLVRDLAQRPTQQRMSDKIHDLMVREIHHPYATDELARSVCMSRWHFCRQFKEETGMSPIQYFQRLRAERAVNLLRTTELSVREICRTIGFESPAHVSRIVRKHTGKTPTQIRREQGR